MPSTDLELPGRLLLVSNRLPITISRSIDGAYEFSVSAGGLVSGLSALSKSTTFQWFGWPGIQIPEDELQHVQERLKTEYNAVPIMLDDELAEKHYNGFSNSILWPLFHYHSGDINFEECTWNAYRKANQEFAKALAPRIEDGDIVWIHDYHLMLLPSMLRKELGSSKARVKLGFFLHTPFPSPEIYRILPVRSQLLEALLDSDLIGFQTYDYARHFINSCGRLLGSRTSPEGVLIGTRFVKVGVFPIGIDPQKFQEGLQFTKIKERISQLEHKFKGTKVIVGVDRLDYIKGIPQKLYAFELFLNQYPDWVGKVVFVQVAIPSRNQVGGYEHLTGVVNELVGRINGTFGSIESTPIHFMRKPISFEELVALYAISDVCLISSTRDGMNLVSKEYIATQKQHGALIISEFAGAAHNLNGSLVVNPWHTEELSAAIHTALTMPDEIRIRNFQRLEKYVNKYTSAWWGRSFVLELVRMIEADERRSRRAGETT